MHTVEAVRQPGAARAPLTGVMAYMSNDQPAVKDGRHRPAKYRVYLRWEDGKRVSDRTETENPDVADMAFALLLASAPLWGAHVAVTYTEDSKNKRYFDFRNMPIENVGKPA